MAAAPKGILIIFTDFPLDEDDAVDEWYTREHVKSRVIVDGFQWGKRYEAILGSPRYAAVYGTDDVSVLASQDYLDAAATRIRRSGRTCPSSTTRGAPSVRSRRAPARARAGSWDFWH